MAVRDDGDTAEGQQLPTDQPQSAPLPDLVLSFQGGLQHQTPTDENGNPTVEILNDSVDTCQQSTESSVADQTRGEPHAGCVELSRNQSEQSNDKDDDWVLVGLDLGDSSQQITFPPAESPGTSGVEAPVCESVSNLSPEDGQGAQMDPAISSDSSSSLLLFCSSDKRKSVQFASTSLHDSVKTTASTRTPTPFASPCSSFTSLEEDMGESSKLLYEALPDDPALPSTSRGTEAPSADLHPGANNDDGDNGDDNDGNDDGDKDAATINELDSTASASAAAAAASTQKRFPFMDRFSRKASPLVLLPHGCPKLSLPQRPAAVGRSIDVMCNVLRDLFGSGFCSGSRSGSCSCSDQVAVTVVPSSSVVTRPEKARQSPEQMQLPL
ncbi:uncharacterized protein LOC134449548 isoform X2 [Engraulis encrasicolus]|uniref:uncharacterized protein LOC134449548 isoform X2 n=1 Tax=Engraulis encrasicolus TaxID=184585 RepID=UPI002FD4A813